MVFHDEPLQSLLHVPPEVPAVQQVDATIHEAEAIGGPDHGVARRVEGRSAMYGYAFEIAAVVVPRIGKRKLDGGQTTYVTTSLDVPWVRCCRAHSA